MDRMKSDLILSFFFFDIFAWILYFPCMKAETSISFNKNHRMLLVGVEKLRVYIRPTTVTINKNSLDVNYKTHHSDTNHLKFLFSK